MRSFLISLLLLLFSSWVFAQSAVPGSVSVIGEAEMNVSPDQVVFTLEVVTGAKDLIAAKRANDASSAKTLEAARSFQINPEDVKTESLTISPRYTSAKDPRGEHVLIGYDVTKQILVTLKDLTKIDSFLAKAIEAGVNRVVGVSFENSQMKKYHEQVRAIAVENAQRKAQSYAQKLGQTIGKASAIREEGADYAGAGNMGGSGTGDGVGVARLEDPSLLLPFGHQITFALGQIKIEETIYETFELK